MVEATNQSGENNQTPDIVPEENKDAATNQEESKSNADLTLDSKIKSKNQMKKQKKIDAWVIKKTELKAAGKWKKGNQKKTPGALKDITRFNHLSGVDEDGNSRKLSKEEKKRLFKELCLKGPRIVIDCDFESLMRDSEVRSLN